MVTVALEPRKIREVAGKLVEECAEERAAGRRVAMLRRFEAAGDLKWSHVVGEA